jgi:hypothetical protein
MNFASASGGWISKDAGRHRIWLHVTDPQISFRSAVVNKDEYHIMTSGSMTKTLYPNRLELDSISEKSTYVDVLASAGTAIRRRGSLGPGPLYPR